MITKTKCKANTCSSISCNMRSKTNPNGVRANLITNISIAGNVIECPGEFKICHRWQKQHVRSTQLCVRRVLITCSAIRTSMRLPMNKKNKSRACTCEWCPTEASQRSSFRNWSVLYWATSSPGMRIEALLCSDTAWIVLNTQALPMHSGHNQRNCAKIVRFNNVKNVRIGNSDAMSKKHIGW